MTSNSKTHIAERGGPKIVPVSAVMPVWRGGLLMEDAIASVFTQTFRPQELIVVDDASEDDTVSRIRKLQKVYSPGWLKLKEQQSNMGPASARNRGWNSAKGDFIAFIDADDIWHHRKIEFQYSRFLRDPKIQLHGMGFDYYSTVTSQRDYSVNSFETRAIRLRDQLVRNRFATSGVMLDHRLKERFEDGRSFSEDALLWTMIVANGHSAEVCDLPMVLYRKASFGEGGLSSNMFEMYRGQIENNVYLYKNGVISPWQKLMLDFWSFVKYIIRRIRVLMR
ncbi:glycosyltransferase [Altererythrobacter confluentis]|uniref:Glycosyltransferase n=1 Tax=Allopontixanthobacter confluentis TaxID=1849021 RepID=A0A6L7GB79_9SPHN|nr:glycosyltransferase family 2 protein [Allopontixanthobacter confluentis]MXP13332.1 glycosyltransferase [Allopontixanthobacter confluentis]